MPLAKHQINSYNTCYFNSEELKDPQSLYTENLVNKLNNQVLVNKFLYPLQCQNELGYSDTLAANKSENYVYSSDYREGRIKDSIEKSQKTLENIVVGVAVPSLFFNRNLKSPGVATQVPEQPALGSRHTDLSQKMAFRKRPSSNDIDHKKRLAENLVSSTLCHSSALDTYYAKLKQLNTPLGEDCLKHISPGDVKLNTKKELILLTLIASDSTKLNACASEKILTFSNLLFICDTLQRYFFLDQDSIFVNIGGSSRGLLSITNSLFANCVACRNNLSCFSLLYCSVELESNDHVFTLCAQTVLDYYSMCLLDLTTKNKADLVTTNVFCCHQDDFKFIELATHVSVFDFNLPVYLMDKIITLFNNSNSANVFISFRGDVSEFDIDAEPICQLALNSTNTVYVYVKRRFISQFTQTLWSPKVNSLLSSYSLISTNGFFPLTSSYSTNNNSLNSNKFSYTCEIACTNNNASPEQSCLTTVNNSSSTNNNYNNYNIASSFQIARLSQENSSPINSPHVYINIDYLNERVRQSSNLQCSTCSGYTKLDSSLIKKHLDLKMLTNFSNINKPYGQVKQDSYLSCCPQKVRKIVSNNNNDSSKYWVCCDKCSKWRFLPNCTREAYELLSSRSTWTCADNVWDLSQASCKAPSVDLDQSDQIVIDTICWAQCEDCFKWRALPNCNSLEYKAVQRKAAWTCSMNRWDPAHANCFAPEKTEQDLLYGPQTTTINTSTLPSDISLNNSNNYVTTNTNKADNMSIVNYSLPQNLNNFSYNNLFHVKNYGSSDSNFTSSEKDQYTQCQQSNIYGKPHIYNNLNNNNINYESTAAPPIFNKNSSLNLNELNFNQNHHKNSHLHRNGHSAHPEHGSQLNYQQSPCKAYILQNTSVVGGRGDYLNIGCGVQHTTSGSSTASTACTANFCDSALSQRMCDSMNNLNTECILFTPPSLLKFPQIIASLGEQFIATKRTVLIFKDAFDYSLAVAKIDAYDSASEMSESSSSTLNRLKQTPIVYLLEYLYLKISLWSSGLKSCYNKSLLKTPTHGNKPVSRKLFMSAQKHKELEMNLELKWQVESELKSALENVGKWCVCALCGQKLLNVPVLHIGQTLIAKDEHAPKYCHK